MTTQTPFWLGGVAAAMASACTHPLDLAKVIIQTSAPPGNNASPGMIRVIKSNVANHGFLSLYQGLSASLLRQLTYSTARIGSYEVIKRKLTNGKKATMSQLILAGAIAGGLGGIAGNPADIVLVRMTSDVTLPLEKQRRYRHALDGVVRLVREEGVSALARGIVPNTTRAMLMTSSQMASYDTCKSFFMSSTTMPLKDGLLLHVIASGLAGIISTTICSPADVIKSRVMAQKNTSIVSVIRSSLREEGPRFLFKGWTPAFIRLGPTTVLLFVFLEQLKKGWGHYIAR